MSDTNAEIKKIPSKGTRQKWAIFFSVAATVVWVLSMLLTAFASTPEALALVTAKVNLVGITTDNWIAAMTANLAVYATSETVIKGAESHMNKR